MSDPNPSIDEIVRDEVLRERIRRYIKPESQQSWWTTMWRHPLMGTILGFAFGVASTIISNHFKAKELRQERDRARILEATQLAQDLSRLMYERRTRALLLYVAIKKDASAEEIRAKKAGYEEAYLEWNSQLQARSLAIRSLLQAESFTPFEHYIQFGLTRHMAKIHNLLTKASYEALRSPKVTVSLDTTALSAELDSTLECSYVITQAIQISFQQTTAATRQLPLSDGRGVMRELEQRCP